MCKNRNIKKIRKSLQRVEELLTEILNRTPTPLPVVGIGVKEGTPKTRPNTTKEKRDE